MDAELFAIFVFVLILVVIGTTTAQIFHRRTVRHEERKLELEARIQEAKAQQMRGVKGTRGNLEERLRVLERIATDDRQTLASQIEELRLLEATGEGSLPEAVR